jgi:hypothetical protein
MSVYLPTYLPACLPARLRSCFPTLQGAADMAWWLIACLPAFLPTCLPICRVLLTRLAAQLPA